MVFFFKTKLTTATDETVNLSQASALEAKKPTSVTDKRVNLSQSSVLEAKKRTTVTDKTVNRPQSSAPGAKKPTTVTDKRVNRSQFSAAGAKKPTTVTDKSLNQSQFFAPEGKKPTAVTDKKANRSQSFEPEANKLSVRLQIKKWLAFKSKTPTEDKQNKSTGNEFDIRIMVQKKGSKYKSLLRSMSSSVLNLNQGYKCLKLFRKAEKVAKSNNDESCARGYSVCGVKFVMRSYFSESKQLKDDVITPLRFASVVTLAADRLFRRKLIYDFDAMMFAHQMIKNPFADRHGFGVGKVPETVEDVKLFYYYLTTTIGVHALMDTRPYICMAIAKWRFYGEHSKRLRLLNNVLSIDEAFASCLRALRTSSYETQTNISTRSCNPIDFIKNDYLLKRMSQEFKFLKTHASSPTQLAM